jgi:glycosyltransferase involved in cell wall biosynthesis
MLSVLIPANNEVGQIENCLSALLGSSLSQIEHPEIIVIANGCTDDTANIASQFTDEATQKGWKLSVLDLPEGGKLNALNQGDDHAAHSMRIYLDADVTVSPDLIRQLHGALDKNTAIYASGTVIISNPKTWISRAYRSIYARVPFFTHGTPGCGVFAVNALGRAKWGRFPDIISDDTYVRLQFAPSERVSVPATYQWPIVEGFQYLAKVRRRQDQGVAEIVQKYPEILQNDDKPQLGLIGTLRLAVGNPVGFCVYAAVAIAVRMRGKDDGKAWSRGR